MEVFAQEIWSLGGDSLTCVLIPKQTRESTDKFNSRALKGYLVGFEISNIYRTEFYEQETSRLMRAHDTNLNKRS